MRRRRRLSPSANYDDSGAITAAFGPRRIRIPDRLVNQRAAATRTHPVVATGQNRPWKPSSPALASAPGARQRRPSPSSPFSAPMKIGGSRRRILGPQNKPSSRRHRVRPSENRSRSEADNNGGMDTGLPSRRAGWNGTGFSEVPIFDLEFASRRMRTATRRHARDRVLRVPMPLALHSWSPRPATSTSSSPACRCRRSASPRRIPSADRSRRSRSPRVPSIVLASSASPQQATEPSARTAEIGGQPGHVDGGVITSTLRAVGGRDWRSAAARDMAAENRWGRRTAAIPSRRPSHRQGPDVSRASASREGDRLLGRRDNGQHGTQGRSRRSPAGRPGDVGRRQRGSPARCRCSIPTPSHRPPSADLFSIGTGTGLRGDGEPAATSDGSPACRGPPPLNPLHLFDSDAMRKPLPSRLAAIL